MTYQRPVGVWKSSPARKVVWALHQVVHKVAVEGPERTPQRKFEQQVERHLRSPVLKYNWARWYQRNVDAMQKADEPPHWDVPAEILTAWDAVSEDVRKAWLKAAKMRADAMHLPFDEGDLRAGLDATMHLVSSVPESSQDILRKVMQRSLENGEGQFGFARRIREEWPAIAKQRAQLIAVTEWNRAASTATLTGLKRQGVAYKRWFTAGDSRVCPTCESNAEDGEIPVNESFFSGDDAPPAHPGCRCNISGA